MASTTPSRRSGSRSPEAVELSAESTEKPKTKRKEAGSMVTQVTFEQLQEQLTSTEEMLEDALAERGED